MKSPLNVNKMKMTNIDNLGVGRWATMLGQIWPVGQIWSITG